MSTAPTLEPPFLVVQCPHCRLLTPIHTLNVVAANGANGGDGQGKSAVRAAFSCGMCHTLSSLPLSGFTPTSLPIPTAPAAPAAPVVPNVPVAVAPVAVTPAVPPAVTPAAASIATDVAVRTTTGADAWQAIREKLDKLPHTGIDGALHSSFLLLLEDWSNLDRHKKLLQQANIANQLTSLGTRYRTVLDSKPAEEIVAVAKKMQNEIITLAMIQMNQQKSLTTTDDAEGNSSKKRWMVAGGIALMFLLAGAIIFVWKQIQSLLS